MLGAFILLRLTVAYAASRIAAISLAFGARGPVEQVQGRHI
jgi:hypothetical protein